MALYNPPNALAARPKDLSPNTKSHTFPMPESSTPLSQDITTRSKVRSTSACQIQVKSSQARMVDIHQCSITHKGTPAPAQYKDGLNVEIATLSSIPSSALSLHERARPNILRRKPSIIGNYTSQRRAKLSSEVNDGPSVEGIFEDVFSTSIPRLSFTQPSTDRNLQTKPERYGPVTDSTYLQAAFGSHVHGRTPDIVQPRTPFSESSVTPSLRSTESPGAFSHATSATSQTSCSPLVAASPFSEPRPWASPSKSRKVNYSRRHDDNLGKADNLSQTVTLRSSDSQTSREIYNEPALPLYVTNLTNFHRDSTAPIVATVPPPPELAHLLVDPAPLRNDQVAPPRPSRDGTPNLDDQQRGSPIIQSSLIRVNSSHHGRRSSVSYQELGLVEAETGLSSRMAQLSRRLSRPEQPLRSIARPATPSLGTSSTRGQHSNDTLNVTETNTRQRAFISSGATPSKSVSRFGLFIRRAKTDDPAVSVDSARPSEKGPAASTDYEGYGNTRVGERRTNATSVNGSTIRPACASSMLGSSSLRRSSGSTKNHSQTEISHGSGFDPVYILGDINGSASQTLDIGISRTDSSESGVESRVRLASQTNHRKISQSSRERVAPRRLGLSIPGRANKSNQKTALDSRMCSERRNSDALPRVSYFPSASISSIPPLSRELPRVSGAEDSMPFQLPHPSDIPGNRNIPKSPEISSPQRALPTYSEDARINKKSTWAFLRLSKQPKEFQRGNFLQRTQQPYSHNDTAFEMPVNNSTDTSSNIVAHYAMLDAEERIGIEDLDAIMQEADAARSMDDLHPFGWASNFAQVHRPVKPTTSPAAFTSFLKMSPQTSDTSLSDQEEKIGPIVSELKQHAIEFPLLKLDTTIQPRPNRLAQIGRIPKVVSKRDRDRTLPNQSFSRPFAVSQPNPSHRVLSSQEVSSQPARSHTYLTLANIQSTGPSAATTEGHLKDSPEASSPVGDSEFFCFPARKNSEMCYSSSSGTTSLLAGPSTAIVPPPGSPPSEDETWKEYDDLLDDVLTPSISATSPSMRSLSVRSDYFINRPKTAILGSYTEQRKNVSLGLHKNESLSPVTYGSHLLGGYDQHSLVNTSTTSISGLVASYGERNLESTPKSRPIRSMSDRTSSSTIQSSVRSRFRHSGSSEHSGSASNVKIQYPSTWQREGTDLPRIAVSGFPDSQAITNLSFSSFMISKWLSFGRVLFSPAHFELKNMKEDRILVIDGLGKDWSYYVALTYPKINVYSLGTSPSHSSPRNTFGAFQPLPNHRHFNQTNMSSNFPFPKGFFAVVVFRFPVAASDGTLRSMISECKRVLCPGGYVEISTLDLDLTNMGNCARRALRELKINMQAMDPNISLKPVSDNIQHLLGRRGFENLNRCIVGIPAAGCSSDSPEHAKDEKNISFKELLTDQSSAGDEGITKMIARVGRWWYTCCYEMGALPDGGSIHTIWNNNDLLGECGKLRTTFKLLICYAQKPTVTHRRTVSL